MFIDFCHLPSSRILPCTDTLGFRDPTAFYKDGKIYVFYSYVDLGDDGWTYFRLGLSVTEDLIHFSEPVLLTPRDRSKNYSSPGCVLEILGEYVMCVQSYPTLGNPPDRICGNRDSRIYLMRSKNLLDWTEPELMRVHGDAVLEPEMGRMIDPYIVKDIFSPGRYLVFYKQRPKHVEHRVLQSGYPEEYMSYSSSGDLKHFRYEGFMECGENVCVLPVNGEYRIYNSPQNGIGCLHTQDFVHYSRDEPIMLGQNSWEWAKSRITAGFVLDATHISGINKYIMFFNGDQPNSFPFCASIGCAWSDDLNTWAYR